MTDFDPPNITFVDQNPVLNYDWGVCFNDSPHAIQAPTGSPKSLNRTSNGPDKLRRKDFSPIIPRYPYTFNPEIIPSSLSNHAPDHIYKSPTVAIPKKILQIKYQEHSHSSINKYLPDWNHTLIIEKNQQTEFISRFFPDKMALYHSYKHPDQKDNLFIYLWLYMYGGIFISTDYGVTRSLESLLGTFVDISDIYFILDAERYITPKFIITRPFCSFWIEVINLMEKRCHHHYQTTQEEIDRNTGRGLLTDVTQETYHKYEIIPRSIVESGDSLGVKDNLGYIESLMVHPQNSEAGYINAVIILMLVMLVIVALLY